MQLDYSIPRHRCRVVQNPCGDGYHVVQVGPSGKRSGISKKYFRDIEFSVRMRHGLTWDQAVSICARANLDRLDKIFGVIRK